MEYLQTGFEMTISDVDCYLGVQLDKGMDGSIFIHQSNHARKLIKKINMEDGKAMTVPADPNQILGKCEGNSENVYPYREAIGSLIGGKKT